MFPVPPYCPEGLPNLIWEALTNKSLDKIRGLYVKAIHEVHYTDSTIMAFMYKNKVYRVVNNPPQKYPVSVLPPECVPVFEEYLQELLKYKDNRQLFKACFGSLVRHLNSAQDLRNVLPDTFVNKMGWDTEISRSAPLDTLKFQNMIPFNQYREIVIPLFDWYLGMELMS